jgi:two-component system cell cycle response regulator DivK
MATILHIEDNSANRVLVDRILTARGHTVLQAADGEHGLAAAAAQRPDLILIDLGLPDLDGQTVAIALRQLPELAATPIVALTGWPAATAQAVAERYGLEGCILKPIEVRDFPDQIQDFLLPRPVPPPAE